MLDKRNRGWVILASFILALMLTAMPLPDWAGPWRPAWVAMVLIYWCIALPARVGIFTGWCAGLLLDTLTGTLLGLNALGLAVVAFVALSVHQRMRVFPAGQQALLVGFIICIYLTLQLGVRLSMGVPTEISGYIFPSITSMVLWPWLFVILRDVRRRLQVA